MLAHVIEWVLLKFSSQKILLTYNFIEKMTIKKKRPGMVSFLNALLECLLYVILDS